MSSNVSKDQLVHSWEFPWQEMEVLIGGKSSIDLPEMRVRDWDDATNFISHYGYDPDDKNDRKLIHAVIIEGMNFIERHLLKDYKPIVPPQQIIETDDVRHLLLWAGSNESKDRALKAWSCALLRVLHTIAHIEGVHKRAGFFAAKDQISQRFHVHIHRDKDHRLWLGDSVDRVELDRVEWKDRKTRESVILKLLHKRANVAESIYDLLGVRIVTKRLSDVLQVAKYLRQFYMITFPNCNPSRARNTLLDVDAFRGHVDVLRDMLINDRIDPNDFEEMVEKVVKSSSGVPVDANNVNPHTATSYRAVQLTCRQLIRTENPNTGWLHKITEYLSNSTIASHQKDELQRVVKFITSWPGTCSSTELAVFYPFEVQIMDADAYRVNQSGDASHDRYKKSQVRAARRRVLSEVLKLKN